MPCEACNVQFTVFRRKRCCFDCKRFYCSNCLSAAPPNRWPVSSLCERCSVFAKRPLLKVDLLQLKPKDLIFYLQSQHISTAGCVEKDELVGLVLNHIQQMDIDQAHPSGDTSFSGASAARGFDPAHSFDSIKQSCQHFFSNISDKVDSFSFEAKSDKHASHNNRRSSSSSSSPTIQTAHISEQPRVSTREIPTYSSSQSRDVGDATANINYTPCFSSNNVNLTLSNHSGPSQDSDAWHEGCQVSGAALSLESETLLFPTKPSQPGSVPLLISPGIAKRTRSKNKTLNDSVSGCDCSDDELITTFRTRARERLQSSQSTSSPENPVAAPSGSFVGLASTSIEAKKSPSLKVDSYGESSESSFEELGAIGGISDDSKTGADTSAHSNEPWQFVDKEVLTVDEGDGQHHELASSGSEPLTVAVLQPEISIQLQQRPVLKTTRSKKVTRRRSDGYLNRRRFEDESPTSIEGNAPSCSNIHDTRTLREVIEAYNERDEDGSGNNVGVNRFHCKRCGKNRINIKKHIEKMRHYLENSQMPECDIKRELEMFLEYLEKRTKSFDCSDSETTAASSVSGVRDTNCRILPPPDSSSQLFDENEGIHVYAGPENYNATVTDSRFINLEDFESLEELENLCVKQLKEVLMLNRIDYKGCCEKQELLERVVRLWKNLKSTPSIDKLQTDELCKICMDAPIECVILECGHMATCTHCGKVLSECPICRQYIVRVVRIFKA